MEVIRFNKKIYNLSAIKKAIEEYKNLAEFEMVDSPDYIEIKINNIDDEVKGVLKDEFANYVLGVMS